MSNELAFSTDSTALFAQLLRSRLLPSDHEDPRALEDRARAAIEPNLPALHTRQIEIAASTAKRKVICAGRRAGKTTLAAETAARRMLDGRRVLLASTSQQQADTFWRYLSGWCGDAVQARLVKKNETRRTLDLPASEGSVRVKTASNADMLRSDYADFLVLDECAHLEPRAWYDVAAPMLLDNDGDAWFISTPNRRNWFFHLYERGVADGERWASWRFTSLDNPHLSPAALAEISADLTEAAYRQEILAEFLEGEGSVFRNIRANLTPRGADSPDAHVRHRKVAGLDWGQVNDFTANSVGCIDCSRELALDRFNKIDFAMQRDRCRALWERWGVSYVLAEWNSIGGPNIEELQRAGLPVVAFKTTAQSKPQIIQSLALALEKGEIAWLDDETATGELEAYESKVSPATGRIGYSAPEGLHDDTVIARALMRRAMLQGGAAVDAASARAIAGTR